MILKYYNMNSEAVRKIIKKYGKITKKLLSQNNYDFKSISLKLMY